MGKLSKYVSEFCLLFASRGRNHILPVEADEGKRMHWILHDQYSAKQQLPIPAYIQPYPKRLVLANMGSTLYVFTDLPKISTAKIQKFELREASFDMSPSCRSYIIFQIVIRNYKNCAR